MSKNDALHDKGEAKARLVKKTKWALKSGPSLPPKDRPQMGKLVEAYNETGTDADGTTVDRIIVAVDLVATDKDGKSYRVQKEYNCLETGRGVNAFMKDHELWTGSKLSESDLYEEFDAVARIKDAPVLVEISHRKVGKVVVAGIRKFLPIHT